MQLHFKAVFGVMTNSNPLFSPVKPQMPFLGLYWMRYSYPILAPSARAKTGGLNGPQDYRFNQTGLSRRCEPADTGCRFIRFTLATPSRPETFPKD
jgi:hypothetical protein